MSSYRIEVQVEPALSEAVAVEEIARAVRYVLEQEHQPEAAEVTVVIADDAQVRELNRAFRAVDSPTDVLAFPARSEDGFVNPPELPPYLGDIVVSFPTAAAQAAEQGHSVEAELTLLVIHGCLHLLGYDHADENERDAMWARQDDLVRALTPPQLH